MKKVILIAVLILSIAVYVYAQTTWSDYDELPITEIADGDDFLVRDVSDATIATGIQKRYLWSSLKSDLIDSLIAGDIPDLSGTYQPLDATLTAVAASTLDPITVTQSVTTDADPYTLTPTTGKDRVVILVTTHADNVDISLSETGAVHLETIYIHNLSANTLIMDDVAAVQEIAGHVELEQDNVAVFQYRTDRWVYIGGSVNTLFLASLNMAGGVMAMPSGTNPTTDAVGEISLDESDGGQEPLFLEAYDEGTGDASRIIGTDIHAESFTILEPDLAQAACDDVKLKKFVAEAYPHGATIIAIHLETDGTDISDTFLFEQWSNADGGTQTLVESIALSATDTGEDDGIDAGSIAADWILNLNLDDASDNYKSITITIVYRINPGD